MDVASSPKDGATLTKMTIWTADASPKESNATTLVDSSDVVVDIPSKLNGDGDIHHHVSGDGDIHHHVSGDGDIHHQINGVGDIHHHVNGVGDIHHHVNGVGDIHHHVNGVGDIHHHVNGVGDIHHHVNGVGDIHHHVNGVGDIHHHVNGVGDIHHHVNGVGDIHHHVNGVGDIHHHVNGVGDIHHHVNGVGDIHHHVNGVGDIHHHVNGVGDIHHHVNGRDKTMTQTVNGSTAKGEGRQKSEMVAAFQLFKFSTVFDKLLMLLGTVGAVVQGVTIPINIAWFGNLIDVFVDESGSSSSTNSTAEEQTDFEGEILPQVYRFIGLGVGSFICSCLAVSCWQWAAERQVSTMRKKFFYSIVRQEIGWFDVHEAGEISSRFSGDMTKVAEGLVDKMATFLQWLTTGLGSYIMALTRSWKLTLAMIVFCPMMAFLGMIVVRVMRKMAMKEAKAYARAGAVAEQALRAIRTVHAYQGQEKEIARYESNLSHAVKVSSRKGLALGLGSCLLWFLLFLLFAGVIWFGTYLIQEDDLQAGRVVPVFLGIMIGSIYIGNTINNMESISNAGGAATQVFSIIDMESGIDAFSEEGLKPPTLSGHIELKNIQFAYPARSEIMVLKDLSLTIKPGQHVALVGSSGCGKSTIVQLLQRFYNPQAGAITIDGHDISSLNLRWFRQHVAVVSQEPVLFDASIEENIRMGKVDATETEIEQAAREANAHDFILLLPEGYKTNVGERGAQLSGGQKQRIAIARALIRNPQILLLDEATSALDQESEAMVQNALEKAEKGRTTITIAHRLSTVKQADKIVAISEGEVQEEGTHDELIQRGGLYHQLVKLQSSVEDEPSDIRLCEIISYNRPEWPWITVGCFAAIVSGGIQPAFSFVLTEFIKLLDIEDDDEQWRKVSVLAGAVIGVAVVSAIARMLQGYCFSKSGAYLTARLRKLTFTSMINQDMTYFDQPNNQVCTLMAKLAGDAALVQGATGSKVGLILEGFSTITCALVIAFVYGWKLAFVMVSFMPLMIASGMFQGHVIVGAAKKDKAQLQQAGQICSEVVDNIRTVVSLGREDFFIQKFNDLIDYTKKSSQKMSLVFGVTYGVSNCLIYFAYAIAFYYGAVLVDDGEMEFYHLFRVFSAIVFGGVALGRNSSFGIDYTKAKQAAARVISLINRKAEIDVRDTDGLTLENFKGSISIDSGVFHYPTRPNIAVLDEMNLSVNPGETVALVGASGCGKSTMTQLMERFYDVDGGSVLADGHEVRHLNLKWYRKQLGIVSQEPTLFDCSIAENIAYGDNSREVPRPDIIQAAKDANIHSFVSNLPQGYDTSVGDKGTQLSGGQKQRIAIARALVRNPKILLLDEATSALDSESEKIVQEALDRASQHRTCVTIAHRLSTIQNADKIAVVSKGKIVETGTHSELTSMKGAYYRLLKAQARPQRGQTSE